MRKIRFIMFSENDKDLPNYYVTVNLPLTADDKNVIKKDISRHWAVNIILLPLLAVIWFWGVLYFSIFLVFVLWYNISAAKTVHKNELSINNHKTVLTGQVTHKSPPIDGEVIVFFGQEKFDLTYANTPYKIEIGDVISIHYSQIDVGKRGILLKVEKPN
jgi:hypothetical protein